MKFSKITLSVIFFIVVAQKVNGQTTIQQKIDSLHSKLSDSPIVLKYFSQDELDNYKTNDPKKLLKIEVQYFYSYKIDTINSNVFEPSIKNRVEEFIQNFDVNKYSKKRLPDQRVEILFEKYGIRLTLFRDDELPTIMQQIIDENS